MTTYNQNDKRNIIMDHYQHPKNKQKIDKPDISYYSNRCIDKIFLKITLKDDRIDNIWFDGEGCAVFLASTDIMLTLIKGKKLLEVKNLLDEYIKMLDGNEYDALMVGELAAFENIKKTFNRYECSLMIYYALNKYLKK